MSKAVFVLLVIIVASVILTIVDGAIGIDLSRVSFTKRVIHDLGLMMMGSIITAICISN